MIADISSNKNAHILPKKVFRGKVLKNVILSADNITNFMGSKRKYNRTINFAYGPL